MERQHTDWNLNLPEPIGSFNMYFTTICNKEDGVYCLCAIICKIRIEVGLSVHPRGVLIDYVVDSKIFGKRIGTLFKLGNVEE